MSMGVIDPVTVSVIASVAGPLLKNLTQPSGPSAAEIAAALERQRAEQERRQLYLAGGILALGLVGFLVLRK